MNERQSAQLVSGQPFNGYKKLRSILVPVSLLGNPDLTPFDLLLYGRFRYGAGNSDACEVKLTELAAEFSVSADSIARSMDRLQTSGLVRRERSRYGSVVRLLWSEKLTASLQKMTTSESAKLRTLDDDEGSAAVRSLDNPESAKLRGQSPQPCGIESAAVRTAYKEVRILKDKAGKRMGTVSTAQPPNDFDEWADAVCLRHPRPKDRTLALHALVQLAAAPGFDRASFDAAHIAWCETEGWREKNGSFAPTLAAWIGDQGYRKMPASTASSDQAWIAEMDQEFGR